MIFIFLLFQLFVLSWCFFYSKYNEKGILSSQKQVNTRQASACADASDTAQQLVCVCVLTVDTLALLMDNPRKPVSVWIFRLAKCFVIM